MSENTGYRGSRGRRVAVLVTAPLAVMMAVSLAAFSAAPRTGASTLIVPGLSVGPARLGMSPREAAAALGPAVGLGRDKRAYPRVGLVLTFTDGAAVEISTQDPKYRTAAGAGVHTSATDAGRLVGDLNLVAEPSGEGTTVWYAFQGIGFVFRDASAVETFVVPRIGLSPPAPSSVEVVTPSTGQALIVAPSGGAGAGGVPGGAQRAGERQGTASVALRDVAVSVLGTGGFTVAGLVVNTGAGAAGPIVVTGAFTRASGAQAGARTVIPGPLAPGAGSAFAVQTAVTELAVQGDAVADPVVRYQVAVTTAAGAPLVATAAESVPLSAYAEFARRQIHVRVDVGAPSAATGLPMVQVLLSADDTGTIPPQWIQQITVVLPYVVGGAEGSQTVQLRPGEVVTVLVPAAAALGAPAVTDVVLGGG
jgi:hypothetical protein